MESLKKRLLIGLGALALGLASVVSPASAALDPLTIDFLDVGQGDATLVTLPTGEHVLIDGGDNGQEDRLMGDLRARGVKALDMVILTHPHADHIGGLDRVLQEVPVRLLLEPGSRTGTKTYQKLLKLVASKGIALKLGRPGLKKSYGPVTLEVLAPAEPLLKKTRSELNDNSIVTRWRYGEFSALMTGDAETEGLDRLMKTTADLKSTVLKVPHHGSRYTMGMAFLQRVRPEVAVVSAGAKNDYGHPHQQAMARLAKIGAKTYVTAQQGTITVTTDGKTYQVKTER